MTFLYPHVLIALILPALLAALAVLQWRRVGHGWQRLVSAAHPELVHRRAPRQVVLPTALALLALAGIIIAAARPINGYTQSEGSATGRNLLIALDISRSMETQDVTPSRLEEARAAAYELIEALPGDKIGLIVFSGEADVVVPLTYDHTALRDALEQVNRSWAGYGGTNFGLLLRCAMQNFARSAPDGANALVILSDGEDTVDSSLQIAEEAKKNNLLVITVGIGTPAGGPIPDARKESGLWEDSGGRHVISKLDMNALRRFSDATGGDFFTMNSGADLTAFAREAANKLERHEETFSNGRVPLDLFAWFAVPSLLALLAAIILGSEWRAAGHVRMLLLLALCIAPAAQAAAPEAYEQGLQAMQDGNFDVARDMLSEALLSSDTSLQAAAHLALGNTQTRITFDKLRSLYEPSPDANSAPSSPGVEALQEIVDALKKDIIHYRDALAADSSLSAAQSNVDRVQEFIKKLEEEIERLKQQQNQQNQDQQQDQQDRQDKDQQQDQQDQQDKDKQQDQQDQQDKDKQQDQQDQQDKDQQQDQQDQQDKDQQQDQQDQQDKDQQQDQQNQQDKDQQQDQQDQQNQDKQQDQQNQQDKDQQQDQQDRQDKDQQQDQQDQQDKDKQQDQQDQQDKDQQQDQQDQQNQDKQQDQQAQARQIQELSDEEKAKQRAAGILRMHLDEEKGSPIPHDNRAVRPPTKDY